MEIVAKKRQYAELSVLPRMKKYGNSYFFGDVCFRVDYRKPPQEHIEKKSFFEEVNELLHMHWRAIQRTYPQDHPIFNDLKKIFHKSGEISAQHFIIPEIENCWKGGEA